jgi:hypothetical protein
MQRINKVNIADVMRATRKSMHVRTIATHLYNRFFNDMFTESEVDIDYITRKVSYILLNDIKKKNSIFSKVKNPKTKLFRRGVYRVKRRSASSMTTEQPALFE